MYKKNSCSVGKLSWRLPLLIIEYCNPIEEQITITMGEKFYIKFLKKVGKWHQSSNTNIGYGTI